MAKIELTDAELDVLTKLLAVSDPALAERVKNTRYPERLINLTSHDIHVYDDHRQLIKTIPGSPRDKVCQVVGQRRVEETICGVPVWGHSDVEIVNLPDPTPNTYYIVSRTTAYAIEPRDDLLVIDTQVKDDLGRVIGCRGLTRV